MLDELEQYDRKQNLEFHGVPFKDNEAVTQIILDLVNKLGVDLKEKGISIPHRLFQRQRPSRTRNCETMKHLFRSRQKRNEVYANRLKAKDISEFPIDNMENLYVNKNLTQRRKRLFWLTKQKVEDLDNKFIWTSNGQICQRKNENSEKVLVRIERDLDKL